MKRYLFSRFAVVTVALSLLIGCQKETSTITGWEYNNVENGGFEKPDFDEQRTGPGLVMIEGGTFIMGVENRMSWEITTVVLPVFLLNLFTWIGLKLVIFIGWSMCIG